MANVNEILALQLQLTGDPRGARNVASALQTDLGKALSRASNDFQGTLQDAIGLGIANGVKGVEKLQKKFHSAAQPLVDAMKQASELEKKIGELRQDTEDTVKQKEADILEARLAGLKTYAEQHTKLLDTQLKGEMTRMSAAFDRRLKLTQEYNEFAAQSLSTKLEQSAEGFGEVLNDAVTLNLKDAFKKGGGFFQKMGAGVEQRGAATGNKGVEGLGSVLGKLGTTLAVVGGAVAGVAALVKVMIDADAQMKEFNRETISSVGALDVMGKSAGDLTSGLDDLRQAAIKSTAAFNPLPGGLSSTTKEVMNLGLTSKEYLGILNKFGETGVTFDKMRDGAVSLTEVTEKYTTYVKAASTYSRMFGEDLNGMAEKMGDMMMDLGMNLQEVKEGFATIGDEAQKSGFGTKRFFNMVLQATTGMGQYNIRLSSTAKLLSQMSRILGMKQAGALFQTIEGKFKGESFQDRTKRILTTGKGLTQGVLTKDAENMAASFKQALGELKLDTSGMTEGAAKLYETIQKGSSADIVKAMSTASTKDRGVLEEALRSKDAKLAERLDKLFQASGAASGDLMKVAEAMQNASSGAKLVLEMRRMQDVLGKPLKDLNLQQATAYGVSVEEFQQMKALNRAAQAQLDRANLLADQSKKMKEGSDEQKAFLEQANKELAQSNLAIENGKVVSLATHKEVMNADDQALNWQKEADKEAAKKADQQQAWSEQTAQNTYDLTNLVSESVVSILETIAGYVREILVLVGFGKDNKELKEAVQAQTKANDEAMAKIDEEIRENREKADELNKAISSGKLTVEQADQARKGVEASKEFERAKRQEKADLRAKSKQITGLARGSTDDQLDLFNMIAGHKGKGAALDVVSGMSAEEAAKKVKEIEERKSAGGWETLTSAKGLATVGGIVAATLGIGAIGAVGGAYYAGEGNAEKAAIETLVQGENTAKATERTAKDTEANRKALEEANKIAKKQLDLAEEAKVREDVKEMNLALEKAGFGTNALKVGSTADVTAQVASLRMANPTGWESAMKHMEGSERKYVQDALVTSDGRVIQGERGDAWLAINEAYMKAGAGGRGTAAGGSPANVVIHINATAGMEHLVQSQVLSALKQYYGVVTGSTRAVQ